jgi:hypothetical protein
MNKYVVTATYLGWFWKSEALMKKRVFSTITLSVSRKKFISLMRILTDT